MQSTFISFESLIHHFNLRGENKQFSLKYAFLTELVKFLSEQRCLKVVKPCVHFAEQQKRKRLGLNTAQKFRVLRCEIS